MRWLSKTVRVIFSFLIIQFYLISNINLTDAFASVSEWATVRKQGQHLAVAPQLSRVVEAVHQFEGGSSSAHSGDRVSPPRDSGVMSGEVLADEDVAYTRMVRRIEDSRGYQQEHYDRLLFVYAENVHDDRFKDWLLGHKREIEIRAERVRQKYEQEEGKYIGKIDPRHIANALYVLSKETGQDLDVIFETQVEELYTYAIKDVVRYRNQKRYQVEKTHRNYRSELKEEFFSTYTSFKRYNFLDVDDHDEGWDRAFESFFNQALAVLNTRTVSFSDRSGDNTLLQPTDVMNDIVRPLVDQEWSGLVPENAEVLRRQLLLVFRMLWEAGRDVSDISFAAHNEHKLFASFYEVLQAQEESLTLDDYRSDIEHDYAKARQTLSDLWPNSEHGGHIPYRAFVFLTDEHNLMSRLKRENPGRYDEMMKANFLSGIYPELKDINVATFKLAKRLFTMMTLSGMLNYSYDKQEYNSGPLLKRGYQLKQFLKWPARLAAVTGLIMLFFAPAVGLTVLFSVATYWLMSKTIRSLYEIWTSRDTERFGAMGKSIVTFVTLAFFLGAIFLSVYVLIDVFMALQAFGLTPIVVAATWFFPFLIASLISSFFAHVYANTYKVSERDYVKYLQGKAKLAVSSIGAVDFSSDYGVLGLENRVLTRNTPEGNIWADLVVLGKMNGAYVAQERRQAALGRERATNYTPQTLNMFYLQFKELAHNPDWGNDPTLQTDINLKEILERQIAERDYLLAHEVEDFYARETYFNLSEYMMNHVTKAEKDNAIAFYELVTGGHDKSPIHALGRGLQMVEDGQRELIALFQSRGGAGAELEQLKQFLAQLLGASSDQKAINSILALFRQKGWNSEEELQMRVGKPLKLIQGYHANNQKILEKLDNLRVDNYLTRLKLRQAEEFLSWADLGDHASSGHKQLRSLEELEGTRFVVRKEGGQSVLYFSQPDSAYRYRMEDHRIVLYDRGAFFDTWTRFKQTHLEVDREYLLKALIEYMDGLSEEKRLVTGTDREYGLLTDATYFQKLLLFRAAFEDGNAAADVRNMAYLREGALVEYQDAWDSQGMDVAMFDRAKALLGKKQGDEAIRLIDKEIDALKKRWAKYEERLVDRFGRDSVLMNSHRRSLGIYRKLFNPEMSVLDATTLLGDLRNFGMSLESSHLKDRRALYKFTFYLRNNREQHYLAASMIDQLADAEYRLTLQERTYALANKSHRDTDAGDYRNLPLEVKVALMEQLAKKSLGEEEELKVFDRLFGSSRPVVDEAVEATLAEAYEVIRRAPAFFDYVAPRGSPWKKSHQQIVRLFDGEDLADGEGYWVTPRESLVSYWRAEMDRWQVMSMAIDTYAGYQERFVHNMDAYYRLHYDSMVKTPVGKASSAHRWRLILENTAKLLLGIGIGIFIAQVFLVFTDAAFIGSASLFTAVHGVLIGSAGPVIMWLIASLGIIFALSAIVMLIVRAYQNSQYEANQRYSPKANYSFPLKLLFAGLVLALSPLYIKPLFLFLTVGHLAAGSATMMMVSLIVIVVGLIMAHWGYTLIRQNKGANSFFSFRALLIAVPFVALFFTSFVEFALVAFVFSFVARMAVEKISRKNYFVGFLMLSASLFAIANVAFATLPVIQLLYGGVLPILFLVLTVALLAIPVVWAFLKRFKLGTQLSTKINPRGSILSDVAHIRQLLEEEDAHYQLGVDSINPATVLRKTLREARFQDAIDRLRQRLSTQFGSLNQIDIDEVMSFLYPDSTKPADLVVRSVIQLALLSKTLSAKEVLFRALALEHYIPASEAYNPLDTKGRSDFLKRVQKTSSKVKIALKTRLKTYFERNAENFYFKMIFGLAAVLTLSFSALILVVGSSAGFQLAQFVIAILLAPLLFIMLLNNTQVLTDRFFKGVIQPRINPEVELPYGLDQRDVIASATYNPAPAGLRGYAASHQEEKDRGQFYGYKSVDSWYQTQRMSLLGNPGSALWIAWNNGNISESVYPLMHVFLLAEEFGWDRVYFTWQAGVWMAKQGKIQDNMVYLNGFDVRQDLYSKEKGFHDGLMHSNLFDRQYRVPVVIGGSDWDLSNPDDRAKKEYREKMSREFLEAYRNYHSSKDQSVLNALAKKYLQGAYAAKPSEAYKNGGINLNLIPARSRDKMTTQNGRIGVVYYHGLDDDNLVPPGIQRKIFTPSHTRFMGYQVGNQQPRTKTNNSSETVFTAMSAFAQDKLQFTQETAYTVFNTYSDYGKGAKILPFWYQQLAETHKMRQDTKSHDTQEAPGWFKRPFMHTMGFSMFNSNRAVGEGAAPNFVASLVRAQRWNVGTMQDMRNMGEEGSARQKWISFLAIKGYWGELIFWIYLMLGFGIVLFDVLLLQSTILPAQILMVGIFGVSIYMIVVASKFKEMQLLRGGKQKNFQVSRAETVLSTAIYLNNPMTMSGYDLDEIDNQMQQRTTGTPKEFIWIPSAVTNELYGSPNPKQSLQLLSPQVKLGLLLIFTIVFGVLLVPTTGLVWSTVLSYFFWAFPLYFSLLTGWYFAYKSGQDRSKFAGAVDSVTTSSAHDQFVPRTDNVIVDKVFDAAWQSHKWNEYYSDILWRQGIYSQFGRDLEMLADYYETGNSREALEKSRNLSVVKMNTLTFKFVIAISFILLLASIVGTMHAALLTSFAVLGVGAKAMFLTLLFVFLAVFIFSLLMHLSWNRYYDKRNYSSASEAGRREASRKVSVAFSSLLVLLTIGMIIFAVVGVVTGLITGFAVPFLVSLIIFNIFILGLLFSSISAHKHRYHFLEKTLSDSSLEQRQKMDAYSLELAEKMWQSRYGSLKWSGFQWLVAVLLFPISWIYWLYKRSFKYAYSREKELLLEAFEYPLAPEETKKSHRAKVEHRAKTAYFNFFLDIAKVYGEDKDKPFVAGTVLDRSDSVRKDGTAYQTAYREEKEALYRDVLSPAKAWDSLGAIAPIPYVSVLEIQSCFNHAAQDAASEERALFVLEQLKRAGYLDRSHLVTFEGSEELLAIESSEGIFSATVFGFLKSLSFGGAVLSDFEASLIVEILVQNASLIRREPLEEEAGEDIEFHTRVIGQADLGYYYDHIAPLDSDVEVLRQFSVYYRDIALYFGKWLQSGLDTDLEAYRAVLARMDVFNRNLWLDLTFSAKKSLFDFVRFSDAHLWEFPQKHRFMLLMKEIQYLRSQPFYKKLREEHYEETVAPAIAQTIDMRQDRSRPAIYGGVLGSILYEEFRDIDIADAMARLTTAFYEEIASDKNAHWEDVLFSASAAYRSGEGVGAFGFRSRSDMRDLSWMEKVFLDGFERALASLDDGVFRHSNSILKKLDDLSFFAQQTLFEILLESNLVQSATVAATLRARAKHRQVERGISYQEALKRELAFMTHVVVLPSWSADSSGAEWNDPGYEFEQKTLILNALKRFPHLLMYVYWENPSSVQKKVLDWVSKQPLGTQTDWDAFFLSLDVVAEETPVSADDMGLIAAVGSQSARYVDYFKRDRGMLRDDGLWGEAALEEVVDELDLVLHRSGFSIETIDHCQELMAYVQAKNKGLQVKVSDFRELGLLPHQAEMKQLLEFVVEFYEHGLLWFNAETGEEGFDLFEYLLKFSLPEQAEVARLVEAFRARGADSPAAQAALSRLFAAKGMDFSTQTQMADLLDYFELGQDVLSYVYYRSFEILKLSKDDLSLLKRRYAALGSEKYDHLLELFYADQLISELDALELSLQSEIFQAEAAARSMEAAVQARARIEKRLNEVRKTRGKYWQKNSQFAALRTAFRPAAHSESARAWVEHLPKAYEEKKQALRDAAKSLYAQRFVDDKGRITLKLIGVKSAAELGLNMLSLEEQLKMFDYLQSLPGAPCFEGFPRAIASLQRAGLLDGSGRVVSDAVRALRTSADLGLSGLLPGEQEAIFQQLKELLKVTEARYEKRMRQRYRDLMTTAFNDAMGQKKIDMFYDYVRVLTEVLGDELKGARGQWFWEVYRDFLLSKGVGESYKMDYIMSSKPGIGRGKWFHFRGPAIWSNGFSWYQVGRLFLTLGLLALAGFLFATIFPLVIKASVLSGTFFIFAGLAFWGFWNLVRLIRISFQPPRVRDMESYLALGQEWHGTRHIGSKIWHGFKESFLHAEQLVIVALSFGIGFLGFAGALSSAVFAGIVIAFFVAKVVLTSILEAGLFYQKRKKQMRVLQEEGASELPSLLKFIYTTSVKMPLIGTRFPAVSPEILKEIERGRPSKNGGFAEYLEENSLEAEDVFPHGYVPESVRRYAKQHDASAEYVPEPFDSSEGEEMSVTYLRPAQFSATDREGALASAGRVFEDLSLSLEELLSDASLSRAEPLRANVLGEAQFLSVEAMIRYLKEDVLPRVTVAVRDDVLSREGRPIASKMSRSVDGGILIELNTLLVARYPALVQGYLLHELAHCLADHFLASRLPEGVSELGEERIAVESSVYRIQIMMMLFMNDLSSINKFKSNLSSLLGEAFTEQRDPEYDPETAFPLLRALRSLTDFGVAGSMDGLFSSVAAKVRAVNRLDELENWVQVLVAA